MSRVLRGNVSRPLVRQSAHRPRRDRNFGEERSAERTEVICWHVRLRGFVRWLQHQTVDRSPRSKSRIDAGGGVYPRTHQHDPARTAATGRARCAAGQCARSGGRAAAPRVQNSPGVSARHLARELKQASPCDRWPRSPGGNGGGVRCASDREWARDSSGPTRGVVQCRQREVNSARSTAGSNLHRIVLWTKPRWVSRGVIEMWRLSRQEMREQESGLPPHRSGQIRSLSQSHRIWQFFRRSRSGKSDFGSVTTSCRSACSSTRTSWHRHLRALVAANAGRAASRL
jgi:hypothetical protein